MALVGSALAALVEALEQLGELADRLDRDRGAIGVEQRLVAEEEKQRLEAVGKLGEVERDPRPTGELAGLPDLEALEGAEDDVLGRRYPLVGLGRRLAIAERLHPMLGEPLGLARCLHLDQADAGPDQVVETAGLVLLNSATSRRSMPKHSKSSLR